MLVSNFENWGLGMLAILVLGSVVFLHYLLFRAYLRQEKINLRKLRELQNLVNIQINRSYSIASDSFQLQATKAETNEKLELIKLQVEAMKKREEMSKSD